MRLAILLAATMGLAACGSGSESMANPESLTPKQFAELSSRCEPYGGVERIMAFRKDVLGASPKYDVDCVDGTRIKVESWDNKINDSSTILAAPSPAPSKTP